MDRKTLLGYVRIAGYHDDTASGTRLLIENRISRTVYNEYFNMGRAQRANGLICTCFACSKSKTA